MFIKGRGGIGGGEGGCGCGFVGEWDVSVYRDVFHLREEHNIVLSIHLLWLFCLTAIGKGGHTTGLTK